MLLLTLRGTPIMYYGDEIGMHDVEVPPHRRQDMKNTASDTNRDPQRTPMQWNGEAYAGFSSVEPWLPVADDYPQKNVEQQKEEGESMLSFYQRLIAVRQQEPALQVGDFVPVGLEGELMAYKRVHEDQEVLVLINFGKEAATHTLSTEKTTVLFASSEGFEPPLTGKITVAGEEVLVLKL